ncbi:MAG: AMP-binding protein, partial [Acidimicrobiia bacterium]|nr:AMP-binding protein [Acidimicrobiia bacterium]
MAVTDPATHPVVWRPHLDGTTVVERFMQGHGIDAFDDLLRRSIDEPAWFWDEVVRFLGLPYDQPYDQVMDTSAGIPWTTWFRGGTTNAAAACVDRWAAATPDTTAIVWEGEDGEVRELTYRRLREHVDALAALLERHGVGEGDVVGIFLPMVPEVVVTTMAVAKIGAIFLPLFSGYGAEAVAVRLQDAGAKALVTADGFLRRGSRIDMESVARAAAAEVDTLETVVVVPRLARLPEVEMSELIDDLNAYRVLLYPEHPHPHEHPTRMVDSEHPLFIAYTSGTTGRPKGSVHVHGGFVAKIAEEVAFQFDVQARDRLFWFADFGWIMGPWEIFGGLANGATVCLYEGAPDWPEPDRLWAYVERHQVSVLGISPTLIRALMAHGADAVGRHDLGHLRILGSTGEPWNEDPWHWYFQVVGGGRCPVINISGGTEVGACFLSP